MSICTIGSLISVIAITHVSVSRAFAEQDQVPSEPDDRIEIDTEPATRGLAAVQTDDPWWPIFDEAKKNKTRVATGTLTLIPWSPSSITVAQGIDLQRSGARSFPDALRMIPGLEVIRLTSTESNVSARGYNNAFSFTKGVMGLIDGRNTYNEYLGTVIWDGLPVALNGIDRVEVIRGPGSFLYGPNAMHGLVAIETRSPLDYEDDFVEVFAAAGSYESTLANATYVKKEGNTAFKATLGWDDIGSFDRSRDSSSDKGFVELRFAHQFDDSGHQTIDVTGGILRQQIELVTPAQLIVPAANIPFDLQDAFVKANYTLGDFEAQVVWNGTDATSKPEEVYSPSQVDMDTLDIDLRHFFGDDTRPKEDFDPWKDHNVTVGGGYRYVTFTAREISDGRHSTDLLWGFVQDEFAVAKNVLVTAGIRTDWHSTSGVNVSPRIAAVWKFHETLEKMPYEEDPRVVSANYLRVSAGFGFRNPSLRDNWFNMPVAVPGFPPLTVLGNEDLDAEKMRSFEIAYIGWPSYGGLKTSVSAYYNLVDDLIEFQPVPSTTTFKPFNVSDEETYGFEVDLDYEFSSAVSTFANYSYTSRHNRDTNERIRTAARNRANIGLRFSELDSAVKYSSGFSGAVWLNFVDDSVFGEGTTLGATQIDAYVLLNGSIAYNFLVGDSQWSLYVQGFNLVDEHREHSDGQTYGAIVMAGFSATW